MEFFAVFLVARVDSNSFAATTREDGRIGLPGGKVDLGETPVQAVIRESQEEGWKLPENAKLELVHTQEVEGKLVSWFRSEVTPKKLVNYKEKHRGIRPIISNRSQILNSGFGNENLVI